MNDTGGPSWPLGDPAAIIPWFESGGMERLGRTYSYWDGLIYTCTSSIWYSASSFGERKGFRDAGLAVVEAGHRIGMISNANYTERVIYIRMSYLRNSDEGRPWLENEIEAVGDIFLDWIRIGAGEARELLTAAPELPADWREQPLDVRKQLLRARVGCLNPLMGAKTLLQLITHGREYMDGERNHEIMAWLDLLPELP